MIDGYLSALDAQLDAPRRARARILAEVRDHLEESVAAGAPEADAVAGFGDPREIAAQFHEQLASASARRAGAVTSLLVLLLAIGCVLAGSAASPFVVFGAQLAAVAGGLGFARWIRYREGVPPDRLADMYRANGLAVACAALVGLAVRGPVGAVLVLASLAAGVSVVRSRGRARVVPSEAPREDALDDIAAVVPLLPVRTLGSALRTKPWLFAVAFASACGLALAGQHAIVEGSLAVGPRQLLAAVVIASIETTAVLVCFAAFGRLLGIRR